MTRKRLEYVDCVSQYYDIPDIERTDEEINMLRQVFLWILFLCSCFFFSINVRSIIAVSPLGVHCSITTLSLSHGWYWHGDVFVGYYVLVQGIR